jgi:hypothetical protein
MKKFIIDSILDQILFWGGDEFVVSDVMVVEARVCKMWVFTSLFDMEKAVLKHASSLGLHFPNIKLNSRNYLNAK